MDRSEEPAAREITRANGLSVAMIFFMKTSLAIIAASLLALIATSGCATPIQGDNQPGVMNAKGPNILNARSEPEVVVLNRDLQPTVAGEILADVKDFRYPVTTVEVKFQDFPLVVQMEHIAGSTWRAEFTPQQLQMLSVSGKTVSYKADIVATNTQGDTAKSLNPLSVSVTAPETSST
jgi:hypothetical protein